MKKPKLTSSIVSLLALLCLAMPTLASGPAKELWMITTPRLATDQLKEIYSTTHHLLMEMPTGTELRFVSGAGRIATVTDFVVPDVQNTKGRTRELAPRLQKLLNWLKASSADPENHHSGEIDIPGVLNELGRSIPSGATVLVIGSPVYRTTESGFSFYEESESDPVRKFRFPTDGHLRAPTSHTPFGTMGFEQRLSGVDVYWWNPMALAKCGDSLYRSDVERWWTLYLTRQGATVREIGSDGREVIDSLLEQDLPPMAVEINPHDYNVGMVTRVRKPGGYSYVTNEVSGVLFKQPQEVVDTSTEASLLRQFEREADQAGGLVSIGVMWTTPSVDVDLWVFPGPGVQPLSFNSKRTEYGQYLRDHQTATAGLWETVVLTQQPPSELEAWVNLFGAPRGLRNPITGQVMIRRNGATTTIPFAMRTTEGAGARGIAGQRVPTGHV